RKWLASALVGATRSTTAATIAAQRVLESCTYPPSAKKESSRNSRYTAAKRPQETPERVNVTRPRATLRSRRSLCALSAAGADDGESFRGFAARRSSEGHEALPYGRWPFLPERPSGQKLGPPFNTLLGVIEDGGHCLDQRGDERLVAEVGARRVRELRRADRPDHGAGLEVAREPE